VNSKKMLRAKEISEIYGIAISTVWKYNKIGYLKSIKVTPKLTLFDANEVESFFYQSYKKSA